MSIDIEAFFSYPKFSKYLHIKSMPNIVLMTCLLGCMAEISESYYDSLLLSKMQPTQTITGINNSSYPPKPKHIPQSVQLCSKPLASILKMCYNKSSLSKEIFKEAKWQKLNKGLYMFLQTQPCPG